MYSKLIKELNSSRQLMSDVIIEINRLSRENTDLRVMLWRMIEKHGTELKIGKIDDKTFEEILSANIYVDDDLNIRFSNVLRHAVAEQREQFYCLEQAAQGKRCKTECCLCEEMRKQ